MKPIQVTGICGFTYRIHNHHGWKTVLYKLCDTRAEFDDALSALCHEEASKADDYSISSGSREDIIAEYGDDVPQEITDAKGPFLAVHWHHRYEVESFATAQEANRKCDEWSYDVGSERIHCDIGGHGGPTRMVDREPSISVTFDRFFFTWKKDEPADAEDVRTEVEDYVDDERPMPDDERLAEVAEAINTELDKYQ